MDTIIDVENIESLKYKFSYKIAIKWALFSCLITAILAIIEYYLFGDFLKNSIMIFIQHLISSVIAIISITFCIKEYRKKIYNGFISFALAFKVGFIRSLFAIFFIVIFQSFYYNFIIDWDKSKAERKEETIKIYTNKGYSQNKIDLIVSKQENFVTIPNTLMIGFVAGLIADLIIVLICSYFLKTPQYA